MAVCEKKKNSGKNLENILRVSKKFVYLEHQKKVCTKEKKNI